MQKKPKPVGMDAFLKKEDPNIEELRKKYLSDSNEAKQYTVPDMNSTDQQKFESQERLEEYLHK
jgi:hypothetical protein